ncbi:hypothetical protein JHW43_005018 [Diplocarpon mali]|nr:hypothetical protein JHW43_005018 [Diplocarpon mali]
MPSSRSGPAIKILKSAPLRRLKIRQNGLSIPHVAKPSRLHLDKSSKAEGNFTIGRVLSGTRRSMNFEHRLPYALKALPNPLGASELREGKAKSEDRLKRPNPGSETPSPSRTEPLAADAPAKFEKGSERKGVREIIESTKAPPLQNSSSVSVEPREQKHGRKRRIVLDPKNLGEYDPGPLEALLMIPRNQTQVTPPQVSEPQALERRRFPRSIDVFSPKIAPANELEARTYLQIDLKFSHKQGSNPVSDARVAWGYPLPETGFVPWDSFRIFKGLPYSDHEVYERLLGWFGSTQRHFFVRLQPFVRCAKYKNWQIGFELRSNWLREAVDTIATALGGPSCAKPYLNEYGEEVKAFFVIAKNQIECQEEAEALLEEWMQQNMEFHREVLDPRLKVWVEALTLSLHKAWRSQEGDDVLWPEPKVYKLRKSKLHSNRAAQRFSEMIGRQAKGS